MQVPDEQGLQSLQLMDIHKLMARYVTGVNRVIADFLDVQEVSPSRRFPREVFLWMSKKCPRRVSLGTQAHQSHCTYEIQRVLGILYMRLQLTKFLAVVFAALALVPTGAHLMALVNKIHMPAQSYLIAQSIYRGWAFSGIVILAALLSTLALAFVLRRREGFVAALVGFLCIVATQIIFWVFTYPANAATHQWTFLPETWEKLRVQWEYSHAASAALNLVALVATTIAAVRSNDLH
jgi:hypothetical protein